MCPGVRLKFWTRAAAFHETQRESVSAKLKLSFSRHSLQHLLPWEDSQVKRTRILVISFNEERALNFKPSMYLLGLHREQYAVTLC